jgi:hypothetical protein
MAIACPKQSPETPSFALKTWVLAIDGWLV